MLYVLCHNDFPNSVFDSEEEANKAKDACVAHEKELQAKPSMNRRRVHWHVCECPFLQSAEEHVNPFK